MPRPRATPQIQSDTVQTDTPACSRFSASTLSANKRSSQSEERSSLQSSSAADTTTAQPPGSAGACPSGSSRHLATRSFHRRTTVPLFIAKGAYPNHGWRRERTDKNQPSELANSRISMTRGCVLHEHRILERYPKRVAHTRVVVELVEVYQKRLLSMFLPINLPSLKEIAACINSQTHHAPAKPLPAKRCCGQNETDIGWS